VTVDILPDIALLEIFELYVDNQDNARAARKEEWCTLVHVCRKWRNVVFGSPLRLGLRLYCTARTPVRAMLDIWPPLPIVIGAYGHENIEKWGMDNILAALEHNYRICTIDFWHIPSSLLEKVLEAMERPFPVLTYLQLSPGNETPSDVSASLLGGWSAPHLKTLNLTGVPFPGLPKLLLSATHLVDLDLWKIPHSGYISPEAMVNCLSVLTRLQTLFIGFESPRSRPRWYSQRPAPPTRTLLPVLTKLWFKGVGEYLEDFVVRINAPLLDSLRIVFLHQLVFDTPQLTQFIGRTPKFKAHGEAHVFFRDRNVSVTLPQSEPEICDGKFLQLEISCRQSDWQLSYLTQACSLSFPRAFIPAVEHLYIRSGSWPLHWQDDIENSQWLEFLHPFTAVKRLYIPREFTRFIVPALQELVGERVTEVLPSLQTLFLEETHPSGLVRQTIGNFVAARQLANYPIAVSRWERKEFEE
jgi:hypothetical protein